MLEILAAILLPAIISGIVAIWTIRKGRALNDSQTVALDVDTAQKLRREIEDLWCSGQECARRVWRLEEFLRSKGYDPAKINGDPSLDKFIEPDLGALGD